MTTRGPQVTGRECVLEVFSFFFFGKQYHLQELLFHYRPLTLTEFPLWKDPAGQWHVAIYYFTEAHFWRVASFKQQTATSHVPVKWDTQQDFVTSLIVITLFPGESVAVTLILEVLYMFWKNTIILFKNLETFESLEYTHFKCSKSIVLTSGQAPKMWNTVIQMSKDCLEFSWSVQKILGLMEMIKAVIAGRGPASGTSFWPWLVLTRGRP